LKIDRSLKDGTVLFPYTQVNNFKREDVSIEIPMNTLYSNLNFLYSKSPKRADGFSEVHNIHNRMIPIHNAYTLHIKPTQELSPYLQSKALLIDTRGRSHGGAYEDGFVKAMVREFGSFYIGV